MRPPTRSEHRKRRGRRLLRFWLVVTGLTVAFAAGLAIGQSLDDNPSPGRTETLVRTLKPLAVPPAPETVTVTAPG